MKWIETWKYKSDRNSFFWNKGFAFLITKRNRCLFTAEVCSSPTFGGKIGIMVDLGTEGFEIVASTWNSVYALGIGTKV